MHTTVISRTQSYPWRIPYSGKLSWICEKYNFRWENFHGLLTFAMQKDATSQISRRKLSHIATKLRNWRKFLLYGTHLSWRPSWNLCFRRLWYYVTLCECRIMTHDTLACINMLCSLCYVPLVTGGTLLPTYHCPPGPTKPLWSLFPPHLPSNHPYPPLPRTVPIHLTTNATLKWLTSLLTW